MDKNIERKKKSLIKEKKQIDEKIMKERKKGND